MAVQKQTDFEYQHHYDNLRKRHYINGVPYVLHCHHYTSLYLQLAEDATLFDGVGLIKATARDVFYEELTRAFERQGLTALADRIHVVESYWAFGGMGDLKLIQAGPVSGKAEMAHSHVDEGWLKKFGKRDKPVNYITQGYLEAAFAALFDLPAGSFETSELESLVSGAEKSVFSVLRK